MLYVSVSVAAENSFSLTLGMFVCNGSTVLYRNGNYIIILMKYNKMIYALTMAGHTHKLQSILFKFSQNIGANSGSDSQSGIVSGSESPTSWSCSLLITCLAVIA